MSVKKQWCASFNQDAVKIEDEKVLAASFYQLKELTLTHRSFAGDDIQISRDLIDKPDAIALLLYDENLDAVVMVEQFRVGAIGQDSSPWLLELVAGIIEPGENIEQVAIRECLEETGLVIDKLQHIYKFTPSPGGVSEYIDLFYASVDAASVTQFHGLACEGEDIKVHVIDALAAINMLETGQINNAFSMIGLQWLALQRLKKDLNKHYES
jgi:ADP-ribose pyrophosphatase